MNANKKRTALHNSSAPLKIRHMTETPKERQHVSERATAFWEDAVAQLEDARFHSVAEAVDRVIDLVLDRIDTEALSQDETREMLRCAFETDPELTEVLRMYLKIEA